MTIQSQVLIMHGLTLYMLQDEKSKAPINKWSRCKAPKTQKIEREQKSDKK